MTFHLAVFINTAQVILHEDSVCDVFFVRKKKLEESLLYQQFLVGVDEEDSWLNEKITLVSSSEVGDTLAAVQVRKHC